jgi:hypothetical protein
MTREAVRRVRRHERADLEHDFVTVAQGDAAWIALQTHAVSVDAHDAAKAEEPARSKPASPHDEYVAERRSTRKADDPGRVERPHARAASCLDDTAERAAGRAYPDAAGHDDYTAPGEELEMHAASSGERSRHARCVHRRTRMEFRPNTDRRRHKRKHAVYASALLAALALAGCGGGSGGSITVGAAKQYSLSFTASTPGGANAATHVVLKIVQPDGTPLTAFRRGGGPHTGVHVIYVRRDLAVIVHRHPPIGADGTIRDAFTFPAPGPYRVVVDAYPQASSPQPNFQLFAQVRAPGAFVPKQLPPPANVQTADGYRFTLHGLPRLKAIRPAFLSFTVTRPDGTPARFTTWYGALAHAIFFRAGSLDYFHTHVCAPGATGCTSLLGVTKVTGSSPKPGKLSVGVLVPVAGTWRLFIQCRVDGHVLTAPFTLRVR